MPLKLVHNYALVGCELYAFGGQRFIRLVKEFRTAQRTVFEHNAMPRQMPTVFIIRCVSNKACHTRPPNHFCNLTKSRNPPRRNARHNFINTFIKSFHIVKKMAGQNSVAQFPIPKCVNTGYLQGICQLVAPELPEIYHSQPYTFCGCMHQKPQNALKTEQGIFFAITGNLFATLCVLRKRVTKIEKHGDFCICPKFPKTFIRAFSLFFNF